MARILDYDWPGNVRELRTAIEHGVVMSTSAQIGLRDLPSSLRGTVSQSVPSPALSGLNIRDTETNLILKALESCGGNRSEAAEKLGISRRTLHRRLNEMQLFKRADKN
jgi:transcriptional regulator of acetoin/glycerol metabolism